jgi:hypothetical protein
MQFISLIVAPQRKRARECADVVQRDALSRQVQQGRATARDQAEDQVLGPRVVQHGNDATAAFCSTLVRDGMAGLVQVDEARRGDVAILGVDPTGRDAVAQGVLQRDGHRGAGLARSHDVDVLVLAQVIGPASNAQGVSVQWTMALHRLGGVYGQ